MDGAVGVTCGKPHGCWGSAGLVRQDAVECSVATNTTTQDPKDKDPSTFGRGPYKADARTDIYAYPLKQGGFSFTSINNATQEVVTGEFNTTTTNNSNELQTGNYAVTPRAHVEVKSGIKGFIQTIGSMLSGNRDGDVNKHEGQPLISNTNQPGVVKGSDGALSKGITIHPGRSADGTGGMSLGCLVCNTPTFNKLNQQLNESYDLGGSYLHVYPKQN